MRILSYLFLLAVIFSACQNTSTEQNEGSTTEEVQQETAQKYTLTAFSPSQAYPYAKLTNMTYEGGKFSFDVGDYKLGAQTPDASAKMCANSAQGQHIHLIVDNAPYAAKYVPSFEHEVTDGEHHILAFLSRSYHESIKTDDAHLAMKVTTEGAAITASEAISTPMLFYSRPKGTYVGEKNTKKVMLDFYPVNLELGGDYTVKADINGEEHMIDVWQPYYIEGLPMGENTITLTLLDEDGNTVDTPLNPVTRKFTLKADPAESAQ